MLKLKLAMRLVVFLGVLACASVARSQTTDRELMLDEPTWDEPEWLDFTDDQEQPVERFKKGFFQQLQFKGGYLGSGDSDDLAIGYAEALVAVGVPLGSFENILERFFTDRSARLCRWFFRTSFKSWWNVHLSFDTGARGGSYCSDICCCCAGVEVFVSVSRSHCDV